VFEEISKEYSGKVSFLKLNTEEQPEIAEAFEVMSIPSLVVVRDGKEIGRMVGFAPKNIFKERLDSIIK
jgi:thioredoxin 1